MKERFKDVKGYKGIYKVSNTGKVKSLIGYEKYIMDDGTVMRRRKILKSAISNKGYERVGLWKEGKAKTRSIHQLVAEAFLNHIPCGMTLVVDHIDNNKLNNRKDNLQLITNKENLNKSRSNKI